MSAFSENSVNINSDNDVSEDLILPENFFKRFLTSENEDKGNKHLIDVMPKYKNFRLVYKKKLKAIRDIFNVEGTIFKDLQTKNSIAYKEFKKGFKDLYFGPLGICTKSNEFLQRYYKTCNLLVGLETQIFAGNLEYFNFVQQTGTGYKKRLAGSREKILSLNGNFAIGRTDPNLYDSIQEQKKKKKSFVFFNSKSILNRNKSPTIKFIEKENGKKNEKRLNTTRVTFNLENFNINKSDKKKSSQIHIRTFSEKTKLIKVSEVENCLKSIKKFNIKNKTKYNSKIPKINLNLCPLRLDNKFNSKSHRILNYRSHFITESCESSKVNKEKIANLEIKEKYLNNKKEKKKFSTELNNELDSINKPCLNLNYRIQSNSNRVPKVKKIVEVGKEKSNNFRKNYEIENENDVKFKNEVLGLTPNTFLQNLIRNGYKKLSSTKIIPEKLSTLIFDPNECGKKNVNEFLKGTFDSKNHKKISKHTLSIRNKFFKNWDKIKSLEFCLDKIKRKTDNE